MVDRRKFKGISILAIYRDMISRTLSGLADYINEASAELLAKQNKLEADFETARKEIDEDEVSDLHSYFEEDSIKYFDVFPVHTYNPMLLILYGQFEHWLKRICEFDSRSSFAQISIDDLIGGNYINKSRRYLEKVARIDLSHDSPQWQRIILIQEIRNRIAHNNANVKKQPNADLKSLPLYRALLQEPYIELAAETGDFYVKDKRFILEAIALIKTYLSDIIDKLKNRKTIGRNHLIPDDIPLWGQQTSLSLLKSLTDCLNLIDTPEGQSTDKNFSTLLEENLSVMANGITEILAFFYGGVWKETDGMRVMMEREKGIQELKDIYAA
jgi:hypothetical protein